MSAPSPLVVRRRSKGDDRDAVARVGTRRRACAHDVDEDVLHGRHSTRRSCRHPSRVRATGIVPAVATIAADLLRASAYVDGQWTAADSGETFPVVNPATGETIVEVPRLGASETRRAIEAADRALPAWKAWIADAYAEPWRIARYDAM